MPGMAVTHSQKMAPGPPRLTASATPAMLPVPMVPARAVAMAWKGVTEPRPPSGCEKSRPSVPRMTAPKRLTCTQPSRQER